MRRLLLLLAATLVPLVAAPATAQEADEGAGITGTITDLANSTVLIEEVPGEQYGSEKAYVEITADTRIFIRRGNDEVSATYDDLEVGQRVEARFSGPVAESYPVQATAASVEILEAAPGGDEPGDGSVAASTLPNTGARPWFRWWAWDSWLSASR